MFEHADLLERLTDFSLDVRGGVGVVRRTVPSPVSPAVKFGELPDADVFAEVDVSGYGGCCKYKIIRICHRTRDHSGEL